MTQWGPPEPTRPLAPTGGPWAPPPSPPPAGAWGPPTGPAPVAPPAGGASGGGLRLGPPPERAAARPVPRATIAAAAAGAALVVSGVVVIGLESLGGGGLGGDDGSRVPGLVLSLVALATALVLTGWRRVGPVGAAGAAGAAAATVATALFLVIDLSGGAPFDPLAFLLLAGVGSALLYLVGPTRGHPFALGQGLVLLWLAVLELVEGGFEALLDLALSFGFLGVSEGSDVPDPAVIGALSIAVGIAYLAVATRFERRGAVGVAPAWRFAGLVALAVGMAFLADDLGQVGFGVTLTVVGVALAAFGARGGHRGTTWIGGAALFVGANYVLAEVVDDSATTYGLLAGLVGAGIVVGAEAARRASDEPDELDPRPSRRTAATLVGPAGPRGPGMQTF